MKQHSIAKSIFYHLYPGVLITLFFVWITPGLMNRGYPPQLSMMIAIVVIVTPVILIHLYRAKSDEKARKFTDLLSFKEKLSSKKLVLYTIGLILFAYLVYGLTQPINQYLSESLFHWLPEWYQVRDFAGYSKKVIIWVLTMNLILNGILAPVLEELYFRGYLLPRMKSFGKAAPVANAVLFSLYHFWQPQIYLTLMISLLPMTYLVWKTQSIRLAIYTHCGLNILGALLSLAMINA
jgi:membrane protease YdiL (CAAX protease family)